MSDKRSRVGLTTLSHFFLQFDRLRYILLTENLFVKNKTELSDHNKFIPPLVSLNLGRGTLNLSCCISIAVVFIPQQIGNN